MKKILMTMVLGMLLLPTALPGQNPARVSTDTLPCGTRQPNYYYTYWYDTAIFYREPHTHGILSSRCVYQTASSTADFHSAVTVQQYAPHPIRVRGLWAMVSQYAAADPEHPDWTPWELIRDSTRLPEYLYLYERKSGEVTPYEDSLFLTRIATVRWDTANPKMLCLPKTSDVQFGNMYCHVYEALFDTVYTLEGEFWIGASANSNTWNYMDRSHDYFPCIYVSIGTSGWNYLRYNTYAHYCRGYGADGPWARYIANDFYGPYGVITDGQRYVEVASADSTQGTGQYSTFYPDSTYQSITAVPSRGFRFSHWNDSVTDNPRTVFVTQDTVFTAYFAPLQEYHVGVRSNDDTLGYVEMGVEHDFLPGEVVSDDSLYVRRSDSVYYEGETARFRARALEGGGFVCWNDSVTDNPRTVLVTQDTVFTAYFDTLARYRLDVYSNDAERGYVTGGGTYYDGDEVTIRAIAHVGYYFLRWNDGVGYIYRPVVLTQDTSFTAIFWRKGEPVDVREAEAGGVPFQLMPNPASGEVRFETEGEGFEGGTLAVSDAAGREVLRKELARGTRTCTLKVSDLPSGTYFVTLTTAKGTGTQKLIVEN